MSLLFELEQHQKLVVYEEGNQILAVRLPLRRGGEFRMRDGCLSDLTGVIYRGNIRLAWQSLEHHIILSGTEEQSDRIVLSDGYHVRQYGGLKLVAKDQGLWLLYSAKEPEKDVWHAYVQQMEEEMGEPQELPGTYEKRPVLQAVQEGGYTFLLVGAEGEEQLYQWEKTWILLAEENQEEKLLPEELQNQLDLRQAQLEEKDRQIAYIREEYEKLRQIALKLQEDGRRMKEYIGIKRKPAGKRIMKSFPAGILIFRVNKVFSHEQRTVFHHSWYRWKGRSQNHP